MHIITHEFEKIWCIIFKSRICDYLKIGNMSQCDANISKIIYTCIKICHHHGIIIVEMFSHCVGNYHVWNVNLRYQIHALVIFVIISLRIYHHFPDNNKFRGTTSNWYVTESVDLWTKTKIVWPFQFWYRYHLLCFEW